MIKAEKIKRAELFENKIKNISSVIIVDYNKQKGPEITQLRSSLKEKNAELNVIKNRVAKKVIENTPFKELSNYLVGMNAFVLFKDDPVEPIKVLKEYMNEHPDFKIKYGIIENKFLKSDELLQIANLPSKKEMQAKLVFLIKNPIIRLVNVLNSPIVSFINVLKRISEEKEKK